MPELKTWLQSSSDPSQVANTVKGLIVGASALIIFVATQFFGITLSSTDIISLGTEAGMVVGGVWGLYGLLMKVTVKLGSVRK